MKKIGILFIFVLAMVGFSTAYAENKAGDFSIGASFGGYFFEGNQDYKNNIAWGIRGGYNFTDNLSSEIYVNFVPSEFENRTTDNTNRVFVYGLEGLYNFMPNSRFVPFVAAGIGAIHYTSDNPRFQPSKVTVDYGAGFKYFVTKELALRVDVREVLPLGKSEKYGGNPDHVYNDLMTTLGFSYYF